MNANANALNFKLQNYRFIYKSQKNCYISLNKLFLNSLNTLNSNQNNIKTKLELNLIKSIKLSGPILLKHYINECLYNQHYVLFIKVSIFLIFLGILYNFS